VKSLKVSLEDLKYKYDIERNKMSSNTLLSDINEIQTGFFLAGEKWFDDDAKRQLNLRASQVTSEEFVDASGKAKVMAEEFIKWANRNGYSGKIVDVWWTARPNSMSKAVGREVDQRKNPTDILVKFVKGPADGFLGLSAKATKGKTDIGFKNPGLGTLDKNLNLKLADEYKNQTDQLVNLMGLPDKADKRKIFIRANPGIKKKTEEIGSNILSAMRDVLMVRLLKMKQPELLSYLLSDWMDAEVMYPPYVKVTGMGSKPPYSAMVMDPTKNEKLDALSKYEITLESVGNESIGVMAGKKKIMKIRFKFESEKMASTIKLSGEPW
jgi:CRISPR/Cas system-associated endonuclease Cas3-HD